MSRRLQAGKEASPAALLPPQTRWWWWWCLQLLSLASFLLLLLPPAAGAQGGDAESKLKLSRQWIPKNKPEQYEIIVPYFMNGQQWKPMKNFYPQIHPARLKFLIQAEREQLVISLERNEVNGRDTEESHLSILRLSNVLYYPMQSVSLPE